MLFYSGVSSSSVLFGLPTYDEHMSFLPKANHPSCSGSLGGNVGFGLSVDRTLLNGLCFLYRYLLSFRSIPPLAGCSCYLGFSLSLFVF